MYDYYNCIAVYYTKPCCMVYIEKNNQPPFIAPGGVG